VNRQFVIKNLLRVASATPYAQVMWYCVVNFLVFTMKKKLFFAYYMA